MKKLCLLSVFLMLALDLFSQTPSPTPVAIVDNPVTLTINIVEPGVVNVDPPDYTISNYDTPATVTYELGTIVTLSAIVPTPLPCGLGCIQPAFLRWEGDPVTDNQIAMDGDKSVTAVFRAYAPAPTQPPTPAPTQVNPALGDTNNSGNVDIVDALLTAQYYVGLAPVNYFPQAGDVNCDGATNIIDALVIAQYYVGLISQFCNT